jgi:signal transduction histidine kinase
MEFRPIALFKKLTSAARGGPVWRGGTGDMVAALYDDGIFLEVSPSAAEMIGAAGNLVGRSLFDFVRREDRAVVRAAMVEAANSAYAPASQLRANFRLLRVRRAAAMAEITFTPLGRGRLMALIRDRSEELARSRETRIAEERVARQAMPHSVVAQAAPQISPEMNPTPALTPASLPPELMANLSHEMKTPLNAIMGFADAMRAETYGPLGHEKYAEYVGDIHAAGAHLQELIASLFDYAKVETGQYGLNPVLAAPGPAARECAAMIRGEASRAGLSLRVNIAPDLPETMIDARVVKQILINLLTNAVKFTMEGEIELSVEEKCGALDFTVRDTGIGMSAMVLAKQGGRYSDTHKDGVRGTKGSGLGLSLAFSLAKLHGGALRLQSEPGKGTTARFTLPVRRAFVSGQAPAASASVCDIQTQLDRVNAYRRDRAARAA